MAPNSKHTKRKAPATRKRGVRLDRGASDTIFLRLRAVGFALDYDIELVIYPTDPPQLSIGCMSMTFADWRGKEGDELIEDEYGTYDIEPTEDDLPGGLGGATDAARTAWLKEARKAWAVRQRENERTLARWRAIRDDLVADAERIAARVTTALRGA